MQKFDYIADCTTDPRDCISIRANEQTEYVMLTAREGGRVAAIDLTPDAAREFGRALFHAANVASEADPGSEIHIIEPMAPLPEMLQAMIVRNIAQFLARAEAKFEAMLPKERPSTRYGMLRALREQLVSEIGPTARFRLITTNEIPEE